MMYKGYIGKVAYDDDAKIFHGQFIGLKDVITFQGESVKELEQACKDSINDYLAFCRELGQNPEKTFSGKVHVRLDPSVHANLVMQAAVKGISLNDLISSKLSQ